MNKRSVTIYDLLNFKFVGDPQISPDGSQIVSVVKTIDQEENRYQTLLYLTDFDTGETKQFTFGDGKDRTPRWSPDGQWIAFIRVTESCPQIWLIPTDGGEARQLTHLEEGSLGAPRWSPDGEKIGFTFRPTHPDWTKKAKDEREKKGLSTPPREITRRRYRVEGQGYLDLRQHVWVCEAASGAAGQITAGDFDDRDIAWSPQGDQIGFISNRSGDIFTPYLEDVWLVSPEGGEITKIQSPPGYKYGLSWSPVGTHLAYIGFETEDDPWGTHNDRLWVLELETQTVICLTEALDRVTEDATLSDVSETGNQYPVWDAAGKTIFVPISDRGSCHIYAVTLKGEITQFTTGNLDVSGFSINSTGTRGALLVSYPSKTAEVYGLALEAETSAREKLHPLTQFNSQIFKEISPSKPEEFWFTSFDDTEVQGWLLKPPDFDPESEYPLILYIHGGPAAQYGHSFFHEFQVLAAAGYVVLYSNPRGSLGREEAYATAIQGNWGDLDFKDLMAAVDYSETLPFIDVDRMAVVGGSYGGFMTNWIVGHTDRFRCAITERSVANRHSAVGTSDAAPMPEGYWTGNSWDNPEKIWQQSPLRLAANIKTPLLIIHSEGDWRCRVEQAEQLFSALTALKREVVFLRYPLETGHGFSRNGPPDLRIDRLERIVGWLDRYLK
jgi:dipeptidyl aminopeptidase/acylaminoacyl peptidase